MKKVGYILLTIILLVPFSTKALEINNLNSKNILIYNKDEEKILYEKNADSITNIASLTKIMTTLISIEMIDDLNEKVTITKKMLDEVPFDAKDLLYASMLPSGADATDSLAISLTGSIDNFVKKMNDKAKELNLKNTKFANTTGYDQEGHYSTLNDILALLNYALENETFKEIFTTSKYTTTNGLKLESTVEAFNRRLKQDISFILGSKTGYTDDAGQCLAALINVYDTNLITITVQAPYSYESPKNMEDAQTLYKTLKENYTKIDRYEK